MTKHTDATFLAQEFKTCDYHLSIWGRRRCDHMLAERAPLAPWWYDLTQRTKAPPTDRLPGMAQQHRGIRIHDEHLAWLGLSAATRLACGTACPFNLAPPTPGWVTWADWGRFWARYLEPDACPACAIRAGFGKPLPDRREPRRRRNLWDVGPIEDGDQPDHRQPIRRNGAWLTLLGPPPLHLPMPYPPWCNPEDEHVPGKWEALLRSPGLAPAHFLDMAASGEWPVGMTTHFSMTGKPSPVGERPNFAPDPEGVSDDAWDEPMAPEPEPPVIDPGKEGAR